MLDEKSEIIKKNALHSNRRNTQRTAETLVTAGLSVGLGWEGNLSLVLQESAWKDVVIL